MSSQVASSDARLSGTFAGFSVVCLEPGILSVRFASADGRLNGLTAALKRDLVDFLHAAQLAPDARVIIFSGEGGVFSAGDDVVHYYDEENWNGARTGDMFEPRRSDQLGLYNRLRIGSQQLTRAIWNMDLITICAIDGPCIQSALTFALCCDFRLVTEQARLGCGTLRFAYLPDENGHYLLVKHLGLAKALDFMMNSRILSGVDAVDFGLAAELVARENLEARSLEMAQGFARAPQVAMRMLKRAIYRAAESGFEQAADDIAARAALSDVSPDTHEGMRAWKERRAPDFNAFPGREQS